MAVDGPADPGKVGDSDRVYFQETLSKSVSDVSPVKFVGVGVGLPVILGGIVLVMNAASGAGYVWVALALVMVLGFVVVGLLIFMQSAVVTVTENGIDVRRRGPGASVASDAEIPFEHVSDVEYDDRDDGHVYVRRADARAQTFLVSAQERMGRHNASVNMAVNAYRNGVRIEQADGPAVYVGSDRPVELAETIVEHAPAVERAEQLPA